MHNKDNNKSKNFIQGLRPFSSSIPKTLKKEQIVDYNKKIDREIEKKFFFVSYNASNADQKIEEIPDKLNKGVEPKHSSQNNSGHIPTYTQDTVVKVNLNKDQQKLFSRNLIKNMLHNDHLSSEKRRISIYTYSRIIRY